MAFLTVSDVARLLLVSESTVRAWEKQGRLQAIRTAGGIRLFSRERIETLRKAKGASERVRHRQTSPGSYGSTARLKGPDDAG